MNQVSPILTQQLEENQQFVEALMQQLTPEAAQLFRQLIAPQVAPEVAQVLEHQGLGGVNTHSGAVVNVLNPDPASITLDDIVWSLSHIPRYLGHTDVPYSVGQHCVLIANAIYQDTGDVELALAGLLHDASEAFLGDIIRPFKHLMLEYATLEAKMEHAICQVFGLDMALMPKVKPWDSRICVDEMTALMPRATPPSIEPLGIKIVPWAPGITRSYLYLWFSKLNRNRT